MRSKVIFGHPKWPKSDFQAGGHFEKKSCVLTEMARNAIKSYLRSSKMTQIGLPKLGRNAIESDFRSFKINAGGHFVKKRPKKIAYLSEMARNAIESDFRSSKMAAGSHLKKIEVA